jgi:hypothetical protein
MEQVRQPTVGQIATADLTADPDEGVRLAQGRFLDELPGAAFAAITLIWIVSSLAGLMWREVPASMVAHLQSLAQAAFGSHAVTMMSRVAGMATFTKTVCGFQGPNRPA